jgi:hypothetical protein
MQGQLEHGIRGFQIDAYLGTPRDGQVITDLSGPLGNATELPPAALRAAREVRRRVGSPPTGTADEVYFCGSDRGRPAETRVAQSTPDCPDPQQLGVITTMTSPESVAERRE